MQANTSSRKQAALLAKKQLDARFFKKGLTIAILSGMCYGLYSAFLTLAMDSGIWAEWMDPAVSILSVFVVTYMLGALGSAVNNTISAVWCLLVAGVQGKLGDFFRTIKTKPGLVMCAAALIGGPIASTAYVVALQMAGSIIIPIAALCPAIGAILGRVLYKQELNGRMLLGIGICFGASLMIASTSLGSDAPEGLALGLAIGLIAALGWGIEGCVAGYGTSMIDYQIGIAIRMLVSGLSNLIILVPIFGLVAGGGLGLSGQLIVQALTDGPSLIWFAVSGMFAMFAYSLWYKGNSMCGAALGMACNGAFSFWGPFFCWIVLGVVCGRSAGLSRPLAGRQRWSWCWASWSLL